MDSIKKRSSRAITSLRRQIVGAGRYGRKFTQRAYAATKYAIREVNMQLRPGDTVHPTRKIEVKQLGLATGKIVPVRRINRKRIEVKYIP